MSETYFEIEFDHPDYSALDPMPLGMNLRYIPANSDIEAQKRFRSRYPIFKDGIKSIKDTHCSTLEEVIESVPWGENIEKINNRDKERGFINYNADIDESYSEPESKQTQSPRFKDVINLAAVYVEGLFKRKSNLKFN